MSSAPNDDCEIDKGTPSTASLFTTLMLSQPSSSTAVLQCTYCGSSCTSSQLQTCLFCGTVAYCSKEHQQLDWLTHKMICKSLQTSGMVPSNLMPQAAPAVMAPIPPTVSFDDPALTTSLLLSLQNNPILNQTISNFPPTFSITSKTEPEPSIPIQIPQRISSTSTVPFSSEGSAFKPYRNTHVFNSISSESMSSMCTSHEASLEHMSSASLAMFPTSSTAQSDISRLAQVLSLAGDSPASLALVTTSVPSTASTATIPPPATTTSSATSSGKSETITVGKEKIIQTDDPDIQIIETEGGSKPTVSRTRKRPTPSNSADPKINYKDHNKNVVYSTTLQEHQKHLQNRGLALSIHQAMVLRLRYIAEHVIRSLNEFGWAVVDNFLGSDHYKFTAKEIERLYERGLFSPGQLMEAKHKDEFHIKDIRSDHIYWYDGYDGRAKDAATVRLLISMIDSVIQHFKKRIDHDIGGRSRAMLAIYPGNGTRYVKHVDNPVKDGRCITTIYYCNENWDMATDGGTLRLYPETSMTPMDIDPRADRLVFFWSDRRNPHEVMPVFRHRFAITIWYMDKSERDKALAKGKESDAACASKKENDPTSSSLNSLIGSLLRPRKNPSTHDLSKLDLRLFPSTSSDPALVSAADEDRVDISADFQSTSSLAHPESTDSGVSLSTFNVAHNHMERTTSLQSISDHFRSERSHERRSSTSSDQDLDEGLPPPPSTNPEYYI
ncbi:Hypoxia-inducible factor prolyl hydroxylase [Caenorhabditis elegans]|uniref:Hypoxia-inducible factor prolyl hydroxylase n=2 Tax=Caenorhabditis elegans TaxID=6239 RepID=EGL9_CAEEL|nr:Hypoxia-inducible factor prolyl hydroxylase [Caenorhabditis elegans]G5EBV0.1 RecName: Full=Hypoxia-inducible factor prolyl hydroxylase; Short=HIF-PH; AltName: Full=Egg-laying defective protein 9; AltName: Full=Hypoxia-inducible factor-proline dioxygenase [Caenorhabditis elegans]AAD56365.1 EGL-9 [Caenorhabditis elegans]CAA94893.2 Hypoxia-inducible factor prolyl hydroxylase [Caenorhabditis elegans]|eukprot:NP_741621.1 Hypoxia-inducible factor prolyl hydroxylase [Caenorhabditis elegans]